MIDLITGHQGTPHISAEQISTLHRSLMGSAGDNKVVRMTGGEVSNTGLETTITAGYWRVHGYDMQITEEETAIFDPTDEGYSRIDDLYVEILQDISSGVQRSELVIVMGEPSATTPTAPAAPTEAESTIDLLIEAVQVASVLVTEGAMTLTDMTIPFKASSGDMEAIIPAFNESASYSTDDIVSYDGKIYKFTASHSGAWSGADVIETNVAELLADKADNPVPITQGGTGATSAAAARTQLQVPSNTKFNNLSAIVHDSSDAYSTSKAYSVGDYVIRNNTLYKCITACSAGSWSVNSSCFEQDTLTNAVTDLNSALNNQYTKSQVNNLFDSKLSKSEFSDVGSASLPYTATKDCFFTISFVTPSTGAYYLYLGVDGTSKFMRSGQAGAANYSDSIVGFLKKGQRLTNAQAGNVSSLVLKVMQISNTY